MLLVGIDPGTETGIAQWATIGQFLGVVDCMPIHRAMATILAMPQREHAGELLVLFEDARLRTWYGDADARQARSGAAIREGVGAVKRDCAIWEAFLTDHGIPFIARKPAAGGTKWKAEYFKRVTGWQGRTNEHGRDAAMLVYGIGMAQAEQLRLGATVRPAKARPAA